MKRRLFLSTLAATGVLSMSERHTAAAPLPPRVFRLSDHGCGRATAYSKSNKIVTLGTKTHAAWLDSQDGKFRVRIRTLDRATGRWSPVVTVGEAFDNHGGSASDHRIREGAQSQNRAQDDLGQHQHQVVKRPQQRRHDRQGRRHTESVGEEVG